MKILKSIPFYVIYINKIITYRDDAISCFFFFKSGAQRESLRLGRNVVEIITFSARTKSILVVSWLGEGVRAPF
jgi:hypothetical protein